MLSVGLTGGIASGKTRVLEGLARKGLRCVDLDRLAHRLMEPGGSAYQAVVGAFGTEVTDAGGRIDRGRLGELVFGDSAELARLNGIVHPLVREEEARLRLAAGPDDVFVTDGALLVEAGFHLRFDRLVVVHAAPEIQLARLLERDGLDEDSGRRRIESQMSVEDKRRFAHFEIDTSGDLADTDRAASSLADGLLALAGRPSRRVELPWRRTAAFLTHGPIVGPGGLEPGSCLAEMAAGEGPDLKQLAARVRPAGGSWYDAVGDEEPGPETIAGATALWAVAQAGADPPFVAGACYTTARLTHRSSTRLANACLFGLGVAAAAEAGLAEERVRDLVTLAARWGGAHPEARVVAALEAAAREPQSLDGVREVAGRSGADPTLAAGVVGLLTGSGECSPAVEAAAQALEAYARRDS